MGASALQGSGDRWLCAGEGSLQRRDTVCIHCIRIRAMREQDVHRTGMTSHGRQHQGRAAMSVADIDIDRGRNQRLQSGNVTGVCRLLQRCGRCGRGEGRTRCKCTSDSAIRRPCSSRREKVARRAGY
jgi:hypothetical protein